MAEGVTPPPGPGMEPAQGRELERSSHELESVRSKELAPYTPVSHGHERKFRFAYAVLLGLGLAGVIAAVTFLVAGKPPPPPAWSSWKPTSSGNNAVQQIAAHIGPTYRLSAGQQLVAVDGGPLQIAGFPVKVVLASGSTSGSFVDGKGALYTLCGLGPKCSIKGGKPSAERHLLLRREALELALYTFRYVKDVKQVVVLLPPPPGKSPNEAMFFRPKDVKRQLNRPIRFTLPSPPPSINSLKASRTGDFLQRLTVPDLFEFSVTQGQDASVLLVLNHTQLNGG